MGHAGSNGVDGRDITHTGVRARQLRWPAAAIFDCDGLLIDSQRCWARAFNDAAEANGLHRDELDAADLNGVAVPEAAERLAALGAPVSSSALLGFLENAFAVDPPQALAGVQCLVSRLAARMPLAVASNGPRHIVEKALADNGLLSFFSIVVSAEETEAFKPEPHVYLEACRLLAVKPSEAVAFEDSARGATAARRAGIALVGVPSVGGTRLDADLVIASLEDARLFTYLNLH